MRVRVGLLIASAMGALLIGVASGPVPAQAQSAGPITPAPDAWWFHGYLEAGGRMFLNNPNRNGTNSTGSGSLAKYYEYSTIKPGAFVDGHLATGTNNGLYQIDVWAKNVGYSDQRFNLDASKAGEYYFNAEWDQTPHIYSTSAQTLYNGVGGNSLTLPAGLSNQLFVASGNTNPIAAPNAAAVRALINANVHQTDIGIRRDTASAEFRWTPTDAWDMKAEVSNLHRTGTQVEGVVFSPGTSGVRVDAPMPVNDTTQNFGLNGEYAGTSPWNQKFNFKLAYNGSIYKEDDQSYTVENPFCPTGAGATQCSRTGSTSSPVALMSLWPDNQANTFTGTLGMDLPAKSRYMGTVAYTMMRQNESFQPFTITAFPGGFPAGWAGSIAAPVNSVGSLPATSLNGAINTFLSNNVLTTQINSELKSKLTYRYYDYANNTPELLFPDWVLADNSSAKATTPAYAPVRSISISYNRQNADADLNWRPNRQWNLGIGYGHERYDWTRADVNVTNENSGKVYADWKPFSWVTMRSSAVYAMRNYDNYDYRSFVGNAQWPAATGSSTQYSTAYRQFYLDKRQRTKAQFSVAVDVLRNLTITPSLGMRNDNFMLDDSNEDGLKSDHSWNAGVELAYAASPDTRFMVSYTKEHRAQNISSAGSALPGAFTSANYYTANVQDNINTVVATVEHAFIPNKFDVRLGYTWSLGTNSQPLIFANGSTPSNPSGGQFPDVTTQFQRFEALAKYRLDEELIQRMGWKGEVTMKLRYAWERTSVANWQIDSLQAYNYSAALTGVGYMTWLAQDNPNYNVHLVSASIAWKW
jgi:MtrB/PioB family decaheme-associated outer membrane protein